MGSNLEDPTLLDDDDPIRVPLQTKERQEQRFSSRLVEKRWYEKEGLTIVLSR